MRRVLVAIDESEASARVVMFANDFFGGLDVEVVGLNVARGETAYVPAAVPWGGTWAPPMPMAMGAGYSTVAFEAESQPPEHDPEEQAAKDTVVSSGLDGAAVAVELGDPVEAIQRAAHEHDADLIVVGSNDKGFLERVFSPSVSRSLVDASTRPLLIVP